MNHELDVVKDIHSAYTLNNKKGNMVNSTAPMRTMNLKPDEVIKNKEMSWQDKISFFNNKK